MGGIVTYKKNTRNEKSSGYGMIGHIFKTQGRPSMRMIFLGLSLIFILSANNVLAQESKPIIQGETVPLDQIPLETKELVRRLLEANGTRDSLTRIMEEIIKDAPEEKQASLRNLLRSDALIDQVIPIYAKYFTVAELKELVAFYKSPVGAKNLQLTPKLMTDVMATTAKYFQDNSPKPPVAPPMDKKDK